MSPKLRNYIRRQQAAAKGGTRHRMWQAMRILRQFTVLDLVATCELKNRRIASAYLSYLRRAGYISTTQQRTHLHEPAIHRLVRNSGPHCPAVIRRNTTVWDPNTEKEYLL